MIDHELSRALARGEQDTLARLRGPLIDRAGDLVEVAYRSVDSPVGPLLIATSSAGLLRIAFAVEDTHQVLGELAESVSPRILAVPRRLDGVARQLEEYFAGRRTRFDLTVDLRLAHGYRHEVLEQLRQTAYGDQISYRQLAGRTGSPRAVRAVGTACATNPIPIVVPCHRVVRSDGSPGHYRGGSAAKRLLLDLEAD